MTSPLLATFAIVVTLTTVTAASTDILLYDLRPSTELSLDDIYEYAHLLDALSGLTNRNAPGLFTIYSDSDLRWIFYMASVNWPQDANYTRVASIIDLIKVLSNDIKGVVFYDSKVPATSNLASIASGVYDLIPICYRAVPNSLYTTMRSRFERLFISKWVKQMFFDKNECSRRTNNMPWIVHYLLDFCIMSLSFFQLPSK
jgi:hypothetical protein